MSLHTIFAQVSSTVTTAVGPDPSQQGPPAWTSLVFPVLVFGLMYFLFIRPTVQAKKQQDNLIKSAKTGDKIVTTGGILGVITNVKDATVIVKVADNVKLEIEKAHIAKIDTDT